MSKYNVDQLMNLLKEDFYKKNDKHDIEANEEVVIDLLDVTVQTTKESIICWLYPLYYLHTYKDNRDDLELLKAIKTKGILIANDREKSGLMINTDHIVSLRINDYYVI